VVLKWKYTTSGMHNMGGKGFYYQGKEFAHIHWNGDLDIFFGKELCAELLKQNLVEQHKYVPGIAVTFNVNNKTDIPAAIFLLRLAYFIMVNKYSNIQEDKLITPSYEKSLSIDEITRLAEYAKITSR